MRLRDIILLLLEDYSGDGSNFNVEATAGMDDAEPQIQMDIRIDGDFNPQAMSHEIHEAAVHEMTHLGQDNVEHVIDKCGLDYFTCLTETEAFASGLLARAGRTKKSFSVVIDEYLATQVRAGNLKGNEPTQVKEIWMEQATRLVPKQEEEKNIFANYITTEVMKAIETGSSGDRLVLAGYSQLARFDPDDPIEKPPIYFYVDFTVSRLVS